MSAADLPIPGTPVEAQSAQDAPKGKQQTTAQDQPPAPEKGKGGEAAAASPNPDAPLEYEWKAPEGRQFHEPTLKGIEAVMRSFKVQPDVAQGLLDKVIPILEGRQAELAKEMRDGWRSELESDKDVGGSKLSQTRELAAKTLDTLGTPELRQLLNDTGIGEHKAVAAFLRRVGEALSEDRFVAGRPAPGGSPQGPRTRSQVAGRWYGAGDAKAKTQ